MVELYNDQREGLVTELSALFKGLKEKVIDDVVAEAKKQAHIETLRERRDRLTKLFVNQMEILESRDCPRTILKHFQDKRVEVTSKASMMVIPEGHIPFVPVIPRLYMGICGLMLMVRDGIEMGYTHLNPDKIIDTLPTPEGLYFIYDVEDGRDVFGESLEKAEKLMENQNRTCLTIDEGIAICIFTDMLFNHHSHMNCMGSRHKDDDLVAAIYLTENGPELVWNNFADLRVKPSFASCRSRET